MSELPAIWPDPEDDQGQVMAPAPTGLPAMTPRPSPAADAGLLERIVAELAGVEAALRRLDDGSYGTCEVCGVACDTDHLAADPLTTRCSHHAG